MMILDMGGDPNIGVLGPPNHPFVHRVLHYFHRPFCGTMIFGNTHTLPETNIQVALENRPLESRRFPTWKNTIFRCENVSFREGRYQVIQNRT